MCNYLYLYSKKQEKCFYSYFSEINLPLDKEGLCIFHSSNIEWKYKKNFHMYFNKLFELEKGNQYNLKEFVIIGEDNTKNNKLKKISLIDKIYEKELNFKGSKFLNNCYFDNINFKNGANFQNCIFFEDVILKNLIFKSGVIFDNSIFNKISIFSDISFNSYVFFKKVQFLGKTNEYLSKFKNCIFSGMTDFSGAKFSSINKNSVTEFTDIDFKDFTNFSNVEFNNNLRFNNVSFSDVTNFIDVKFSTLSSSLEYMEYSISFKKIEIKKEAYIYFKSTISNKLLFEKEVSLDFKNEVLGKIEFENVNFIKFTNSSKKQLLKLEKLNKVIIGKNCIKYRNRSPIKEISINEKNRPLILEICNTFINYFTVNNGFNLGFEIIEKTNNKIFFFYFTDENISTEIFVEKLKQTEKKLWYLIFPGIDNKLQINQKINNVSNIKEKESLLINTVDGLSSLISTLFRVSIRISVGRWKEKDTKSLINALNNGTQEIINSNLLHQTIINNYNQDILLGINNKQLIEVK